MAIRPTTDKVAWHLRCNLYPPVTAEMVPYALRAIGLCRRGTLAATVNINGRADVPAGQVVDDLRLEEFVGARRGGGR